MSLDILAEPDIALTKADYDSSRPPMPPPPGRGSTTPVPLRPDPDVWRDAAACKGCPPQLFFAELGGEGTDEAKAVCASCPVQPECLEYALVHESGQYATGIWGGMSLRQRRIVRRQRGMAATYDRECRVCGIDFTSNSPTSRLCSDECRAQARTETCHSYYLRKTAS